jgi:hypothetical protein
MTAADNLRQATGQPTAAEPEKASTLPPDELKTQSLSSLGPRAHNERSTFGKI